MTKHAAATLRTTRKDAAGIEMRCKCGETRQAQLRPWGRAVGGGGVDPEGEITPFGGYFCEACESKRCAAWIKHNRRHEVTADRDARRLARAGYIAPWLEIALFLLACFALFCLAASRPSAAEWTFEGRDAVSGARVDVLQPAYQCAANRAADAGSRAGIDLQLAAGRVAK